MSHVFHRSALSVPPMAVAADGHYIIDINGRRYLDASGGAAVSCIGHGDPRVVAAVAEQIARLDYAHSGAFTSPSAEELAAHICAEAGQGMARVYFVGSGSEAVEAAIKMARQCQIERRQPSRHVVISRRLSYHGNTLGALGRSGSETRRAPYAPMLQKRTQIAPCFPYHYAEPGETPEAYGLRAAEALEAEILRLGSENVAAFLAETVVGATSGAVVPATGYFRHIREICDRYGVLLICDEVMCGAHRTGPFLACSDEGVSPDIVTLAKGLGGGYLPIGAVVCRADVHDSFAQGSGAFTHGHTYMAHPVACAAALEVQRVIVDDRLAERVVRQGALLDAALRDRLSQHTYVGDIRGRGLLYAVELVADRETRVSFDPEMRLAARIGAQAKGRGLLVYPGSGTIDGLRGDHVLLAPAYSIDAQRVGEIADILTEAIDAALG
ncbi:aspartate aminotransferase family protein [Mesorhizobium japonicum]|uniref:Aminotransferase n=1 Tax=Mesorhizobium japonicum (strain LMG 29417 / CECT 9101 / MAFF 303099) TaxID=266835 RepID=Q98AI1_RHILO|nr:aspartate aminotransferase family protein [Mesorhizobium japonicum]BAB52349.1 aminotransferase [Mesorhizobium japonicum MAFF 303099]